jgi:hypothetical protein
LEHLYHHFFKVPDDDIGFEFSLFLVPTHLHQKNIHPCPGCFGCDYCQYCHQKFVLIGRNEDCSAYTVPEHVFCICGCILLLFDYLQENDNVSER